VTTDALLAPGTPAPDFERAAHDGSTVRLSSFRGKSAVVLFFYPKDDSLICTREACAFRDSHADFQRAGAEVLGVSPDPLLSHQAFAEGHRLPFRLVSDADGSLARAYGVSRFLGVLPGRATFVVDKRGVVRRAFQADLRARHHVDEALQALKTFL
jgi:thioredoxin-dependent peroxiredoxin